MMKRRESESKMMIKIRKKGRNMRRVAVLLTLFMLAFSAASFAENEKSGKSTTDEINQDINKAAVDVGNAINKGRDEVNKTADKILKKKDKDKKRQKSKQESKKAEKG